MITPKERKETSMNILFFLTPKSEVAFIYDDETLRQALEKMEHHKYSAVPIINRMGKYIGTITEGDMLWGIKNQYDLNLRDAQHVPVSSIRRRLDNRPVYVNASTRFTDGFEFGLGAEIGISTQKMHARGPMGLEELTSCKYVIYGAGQVR